MNLRTHRKSHRAAWIRANCIVAILMAASAPGLAQAVDLKLRAVLIGGGVVSATESPATGEALAVLEEDNDMRLDLVYSGLVTGCIGAALHVGRDNENGLKVADIDIDVGSTEGRVSIEELRLDDDDAQRVRDGESYVVISTIGYPDGAIRGQLVPQPLRVFDLPVED